jgi:TolB-like protein
VVVVAALAIAVVIYVWKQPPILKGPPLSSIAVLPFEDMSPGGDQAWLANGMAEELIGALSRIKALRVIARTSSFAVRREDIQTVGAKLSVGSVVEGSVRRSGDDLRITAQLIRVADGSHLWSARYDRKLAEVFAIQSEIAWQIAEAVRSELGIEDLLPVWLRRQRYAPSDIRAYELVMTGVRLSTSLTEAAIREAGEYYLQAVEIDPDYAQAHAMVGCTHMLLWNHAYDRSDEQLSKVKDAASCAFQARCSSEGL